MQILNSPFNWEEKINSLFERNIYEKLKKNVKKKQIYLLLITLLKNYYP